MISPDIIYFFLFSFIVALIGACMGSFASAIAHRTLSGQSWISVVDKNSHTVKPARSECPLCYHQLSLVDLIPVLSWALSGGKCRYCRQPISVMYPFVELAGALILWLVWCFGCEGWEFILFALGLPFSLAAFLLMIRKFSPPSYMWGVLVGQGALLYYVFLF